MVEISLYALLVILEIGLLVAVVAGVSLFQWRKSRRELIAAQQALHAARSAVRQEVVERRVEVNAPQRGYADFLNDQLDQSSLLLGDDPEPAGDSGGAALAGRQMLAARHQFLQLELDVHRLAAGHDPEARRSRVISGMRALLDGLGLQPESAAAQPEADAADAAPADASRARSEELKLRDQIEHLRSVIGNQHSVMRELRQLLEEHGADSEELQEALRKLGDAEAQGTELQRCLEVMEQENLRLKQSAATGGTGTGPGPDAEMLRDLVGSQQRTIGKLQNMLRSLSADPARARELDEAITKIQRANNELNSCVMVLEDENSMLRGRIETLEEQLAGLEVRNLRDGVETDPGVAADLPVVEEALLEDFDAAHGAGAVPAADVTEQNDTDMLLADLFGGTAQRVETGKAG